jgi:hypothetical protein
VIKGGIGKISLFKTLHRAVDGVFAWFDKNYPKLSHDAPASKCLCFAVFPDALTAGVYHKFSQISFDATPESIEQTARKTRSAGHHPTKDSTYGYVTASPISDTAQESFKLELTCRQAIIVGSG